jgi:hypothetical protein
MFRVYLDNCVYNRPFDDQTTDRVRTETIAVLRIFIEITSGRLQLIWSYVNESENFENPFFENRWAIAKWRDTATSEVIETPESLQNASELISMGLKVGDALHIAAAVNGKADFFLTTDDKILRKLSNFGGVMVLDPVRMVAKIDEYAN